MSNQNQAAKVPTGDDVPFNPADYEDYAQLQQDEASSENQKQTFAHSSYEAKGILKGFRLLPNRKTFVADVTILAGSTLSEHGEEVTRFLNGSFFVTKSMVKLATSLLNAKFGDEGNGVRCTVKIGNFHDNPSLSEDKTKIYSNYTGFLNELTFGN